MSIRHFCRRTKRTKNGHFPFVQQRGRQPYIWCPNHSAQTLKSERREYVAPTTHPDVSVRHSGQDVLQVRCSHCASAEAWMATLPVMCRCTADDVWLQPLADKFARLALQLLARFAAWLGAGMDARSVAAAGAAVAPNDADPAQPSSVVRAPGPHTMAYVQSDPRALPAWSPRN